MDALPLNHGKQRSLLKTAKLWCLKPVQYCIIEQRKPLNNMDTGYNNIKPKLHKCTCIHWLDLNMKEEDSWTILIGWNYKSFIKTIHYHLYIEIRLYRLLDDYSHKIFPLSYAKEGKQNLHLLSCHPYSFRNWFWLVRDKYDVLHFV